MGRPTLTLEHLFETNAAMAICIKLKRKPGGLGFEEISQYVHWFCGVFDEKCTDDKVRYYLKKLEEFKIIVKNVNVWVLISDLPSKYVQTKIASETVKFDMKRHEIRGI